MILRNTMIARTTCRIGKTLGEKYATLPTLKAFEIESSVQVTTRLRHGNSDQ
jgi:hypothetical protein